MDIAAESAATMGVEHITGGDHRGAVRGRHPRGGLVPRRPGGRPGARAAVLRRPRGPQAREGRAVRRGRRRAVRRLQRSTASRCQLARVRADAGPACAGAWARCRRGCPTACAARTCCAVARSRSSSATTATPELFRDDELAGFLRGHDPDLSHVTVTGGSTERTRAAGYDDVTAMQYVDLFTWLRGDILVKADKMTMANSLELRVPFLDSEVFKVASTLPVDQRVHQGRATKYALRRAMEQIVPAHVLQPAQARLPGADGEYLAEPLHEWAREDHRREPDRRVAGQRAGARRCSTRTGRTGAAAAADRYPASSGAAGLHDLARHLRGGADHARRPGARLPRPPLSREPLRPGIATIPGLGASNARRASRLLSGTSRRRRRNRPRSGCRS